MNRLTQVDDVMGHAARSIQDFFRSTRARGERVPRKMDDTLRAANREVMKRILEKQAREYQNKETTDILDAIAKLSQKMDKVEQMVEGYHQEVCDLKQQTEAMGSTIAREDSRISSTRIRQYL